MEEKINDEKKDDKNKEKQKSKEKENDKKEEVNLLNKKTKRFKHKNKNKKQSKNKGDINRKLEPIEQLYQKAKNIYETKTSSFDLDKIDYNQKVNKEKRWTHDILQKGTFDDKISALLLYIRENPKMTLKYLEILIRLSENKNRRKNDAVIIGLKDLFLESILQGKKYVSFNNKYKNVLNDKISEDELFNSYYEDKVHHLYLRFVNLLEESINNESIINIKKKNMEYLSEMLIKQPESEEKILQDIVNKLGDTSTEISNFTIKLLNKIQEIHMNMSNIIFKYVTIFYTMNDKNESKLNALNYLVQMEIPNINKKIFLEESINFFFGLFNQISTDNENNNNKENEKKLRMEKNKKKQKKIKKMILENKNKDAINDKLLSLIVKRINILFKFIKNQKNQMEKINEIIESKISILFKLSHSKSFKLSIEILKLLFGIITTQDQNFVSRYYKSLYELISSKSLSSSKYVKEALKLILVSLMFDNNNNRISSFIKRLLEMCLISEPPFIICDLIIISQVIRNKNKLWKMLEREQSGVKLFYDSTKRDPQFAQGEYSFLNELYLLEKHYHPSVQRMAKFILENYNKDIISYNGDPLLDFSLINFLEKFMLKNPKIKKEKKEIKKITNDDEELKKFIQDDENNNENKDNKNIIMEENDFEFIDKFNKIYPEITSDKNYLKKMKKKEKKMRTEEDVDDMIGDEEYVQKENEDMEKFADKVIDEEYKKFGKHFDDDDDLLDDNDNDNDLENNNKEEEVDDLFTEDENEENEDINEEGEENENLKEEEKLDENENNKGNKKNKNKKKKDSGFVDAETYYNNLKNKKKKIK